MVRVGHELGSACFRVRVRMRVWVQVRAGEGKDEGLGDGLVR